MGSSLSSPIYIRWFKDLSMSDIPLVGGKNASLGEMYSKLTKNGLPVPNGFALTADAYWAFLRQNGLDKRIKKALTGLDVKNVRALAIAGAKVRNMIMSEEFPKEIEEEIIDAYKKLSVGNRHACSLQGGTDNPAVAVRSSATAEDLPDASFAGQQETYLNVKGEKELLIACKKCVASLFTDRAISYREAKGFEHTAVALSVGVQQMVRSDLAASGVMFTLDTESGFDGVVLINAAYGLGEYVVKGRVTPDQFFVFKEGVKNGYKSIISRKLGSKEVKLVYGKSGTRQEQVRRSDQQKYCLTEDEVIQLAKWGVQIEEHYGHAMDIEWAKDGRTGKLYIVQARGETVKSRVKKNVIETYKLQKKGAILLEGVSVGQKIGQGKVRVINSPKQMKQFKPGEVLVTRITDPDWEPIMRIAGAIITEQGGKTSHAAIVSRELGVPCIVGAAKARKLLKNRQEVTASCAEGEVGYIYKGRLPFEVERQELKEIPATRTKILMNVGEPDSAFNLASIPNDGVGLAREEFIFTNFIKIHPLALVNYDKVKSHKSKVISPELDKQTKEQIDKLTLGYKDKSQYCVDKLAEGIAFIASAFYPNQVIVRLSDFKTNEYATLIGGSAYEPKEENPMLGWRGASRYYDPNYKPGFKLECLAFKKVREEWGLKNVIVMVPFCRTIEEGKKVLATMKEFGLERGVSAPSPVPKGPRSLGARGEGGVRRESDKLQVFVMCEIPSNVILAKEFCEIFDGFSIGSNDLTQLTLGVDRDSALVSHVYDENNAAVKKLIRDVIQTAHKYGRKVGICGQAPSDYPAFAEFLVQEGIDSISLNPDTVLKTRERIAAMEKKIGKKPSAFKVALASKLLLVFGVLGLATALGGYACQTIDNKQVEQNIRASITAEMGAEIASLKGQLREEMQRQIAERTPQNNIFNENGFITASVTYPFKWSVDHGAESLKFTAVDGSGWFSIFKQKTRYGGVPENRVTTSTWKGYPIKRFNVRDANAVESWVMEVYPQGYDKGGIIEIAGDPKNFEAMARGIGRFEARM